MVAKITCTLQPNTRLQCAWNNGIIKYFSLYWYWFYMSPCCLKINISNWKTQFCHRLIRRSGFLYVGLEVLAAVTLFQVSFTSFGSDVGQGGNYTIKPSRGYFNSSIAETTVEQGQGRQTTYTADTQTYYNLYDFWLQHLIQYSVL